MKPPDSSLSSAELAAHASYLRGLARALLGERPEADDLVQDTLVAALEHPPRSVAGLRAWLATVARDRAMDRTSVPSARTDEGGEFLLDWVQSGEVEVQARVPRDQAAGHARARLVCEPDGTHQVELTLSSEPAIRGRVVDAEGDALEGWHVYWKSSEWLDMSPTLPGTRSTLGGFCVTDTEGYFAVPDAEELRWDVSVAAPGENPFPPRAEHKGVSAVDGALTVVVESSFTEPCVLVLRLLDADGRPPQDVQAALWDEHRSAGVLPEYDASTGVATWSISLPGRYGVQVRRGEARAWPTTVS